MNTMAASHRHPAAGTLRKLFSTIAVLSLLAVAGTSVAQQSGAGTVAGTVSDPTGAVVPGATVEIRNPVSGFERTAVTNTSGTFNIPNVPFNNYHLTVHAPGFAPYVQDIDVRSVVPVNVNPALKLKQLPQTVTVEGTAEDLLENTPSFHTDVDRGLFDKLPLESQSSSVSSLVTLATPGIAADSNGLFHGMGDHAENSFSVDGQPITDQFSKVFSNQIPIDSIESLEVIAGAPPAQYGDKTSVVINATTRSGQGVTDAQGRADDFLRQLWHFQCRFQSRLRRSEVGEFRLVERTEQRTLPRSAGVRGDARQGQPGERIRPAGLSIV